MGRPPAPQRREEILELAIAYLARNGLANLTMRGLATAINATTSVIFYQFGSKEKLVEAALARARSANLAMLEHLRSSDPDATVAQAFVEIWDWWMREPPRLAYSRLNMEAMMTDAALSDETRAELLSYWIDYFTRWLVQDGHPPADARTLSTLLLATQTGLTVDLISTGEHERLRTAVLRFSRFLEAPTANGE